MPVKDADSSGAHVVNVIGGLGNQLFQYLFGETLAARTGTPTLYDLSGFRDYRLHTGYAIESMLGAALPILPEAELPRRLITRYPLLQKVVRKLPAAARALGCETDRTFTLENGRPGAGRVFVGYWQSQAYTRAEIRRVADGLRFDPAVESAVRTALAGLGPPESIAVVHVRRGNYVTVGPKAFHYALGAGYFHDAMRAMQQAGVKRFVAVSEDREWVEAELAPHFPLVSLAGEGLGSVAADLCMLSAVPNKILSNSTFAWWGARMDPAPGRVIAPRPWSRPIPFADLMTPRVDDAWTLIDTTPP
jgi:hypothetical protein